MAGAHVYSLSTPTEIHDFICNGCKSNLKADNPDFLGLAEHFTVIFLFLLNLEAKNLGVDGPRKCNRLRP